MMKLVVDSSAIMGLAKTNRLDLLKNYSFVVPGAVYREVVASNKPESIIFDVQFWNVDNPEVIEASEENLSFMID